jgi:hypothetical protein
MTDQSVSSQVYKSRDQIRNQITDLIKNYLELENVDLTKSSFLSFMVDTLSVLTSNLLFYQISTYREFFLTKAQLPESIFNLAAFLGYSPTDATPATANVLFTIPFGFQDPVSSFTIPEGFELSGEGGIKFKTYYSTAITVTSNSSVSITVTEGNRIYRLPVTIESDQFLFVLPFRNFSTQQQEFQVSEDLQTYQFVSLEVPFSGQLSELTVQVRPPGSTGLDLYTEVASLFLMDQNTKGYVNRRTDTGVDLQFGNGLIGYQPEAGATVFVDLSLTDGSDGNVIAGSINSKDRIYNTNLSGITQVVQYTVTNASAAFGGADEESIEETRRGAIANISALERILTENDFVNADVIIDNSPIGQNSLPVLKRSDLKVNEICLFSTLYFVNDLVPTRNIFETFSQTEIPRQTVIDVNGTDFYTVFDMEIDPLNTVANYTYILFEIEQIPTLVTSYGSTYDLFADNLIVTRNGNQAEYRLTYQSTESDPNLATCEMEISENGATYTMTNDGTAFVLIFPDYTVIPKGELTYFFTIGHSAPGVGLLGQYSAEFVFRLSLDDFTMSNVVEDGTSFIVYDIPVIKKEYYDSINQREFETQVLQQLLTTIEFKDYRMLTDFINFKFANTTGLLQNMKLNEVTLPRILDILSVPPTSGNQGDRYIVLNGTGAWLGQDNNIASLSDATSMNWVFTEPTTEDIAYVINKGENYLFSESGWLVPEYNIPLTIELDVFKDATYSGSIGDLTQEIRTTLVEAFEGRFGINVDLYRSEIIDTVHNVDGVEHCRLIKPESSIFFNFDINDFSQEQLLEYGPEYIYFTSDDITIRIF